MTSVGGTTAWMIVFTHFHKIHFYKMLTFSQTIKPNTINIAGILKTLQQYSFAQWKPLSSQLIGNKVCLSYSLFYFDIHSQEIIFLHLPLCLESTVLHLAIWVQVGSFSLWQLLITWCWNNKDCPVYPDLYTFNLIYWKI